MDAASDEFAAYSFRGATIKGIARRARWASQALICWYFPKQRGAVLAIVWCVGLTLVGYLPACAGNRARNGAEVHPFHDAGQ